MGDVGQWNGIWGSEDGVHIDSVTGGAIDVDNGDSMHTDIGGGLIVGIAGDAVDITNSGGPTDDPSVENVGGLMWGGHDGVHMYNVAGGVTVDNTNGQIFGLHEGVHLASTEDGDVAINNAAGLIEGFYDDGIHIWNVRNGVVWIKNGDFPQYDNVGTNGGLIVSADSAISVDTDGNNVDVLLSNASGGGIIGEGSWHEPVVDLRTLGGEHDREAFIYNAGVMASSDEPYFVRDTNPEVTDKWDAPDPIYVPTPEVGFSALTADVNNISAYVWSGGQSGNIADLTSGHDLSDYAAAASDLLIKARGAHTVLINDGGGLMIGRVNLDGYNFDGELAETFGNYIANFGTWLVTDDGHHGNEIHGSSSDEIDNVGLIQGAFSSEDHERLSFDGVNSFYNGLDDPIETHLARNGLISLIDGGTGDVLKISHDFIGNDGTSFIGLDVNFVPTADAGKWIDADHFYLDNVTGSTGLIIHKVNTGVGADQVGEMISVGHADTAADCGNLNACEDGDPFYVAPQSQGYLNVGGTGAIQDGMYAWYLTQQGTNPDPDYVLVSDWAPQAQQLGALVTGGQNIWYDTTSEVQDRIDNSLLPGGGGADLDVGESPQGPSTGIVGWAKATGSMFRRNSSVTETVPPAGPVTIDTSLVQSTFGLLAGADIDPGDTSGIRAGAFGGVIGSSLGFSSYGATATYAGGTLGGYVTYQPDPTNGLFADGEAKADLLSVSYTAPFAFTATGTMTSVGVQGNVGYRVDMGGSYIAPVGSLAVVDTMLSGFSAGGGTATFSNGLSIRPGIGVVVGTSVGLSDGMIADLSGSFKLWDELGAPNTVTLSDGTNTASFGDSISGVFAEIRGNATLHTSVDGLSVFGSAGLKTNGSFYNVDGKVGVTKSF